MPITKKTSEKKAGDEAAKAKKPAVKRAPVKAVKAKSEEAVVIKSEPAEEKKPVAGKAKKPVPADGYIYAVGRRKSAVATAKLWSNGQGEMKVNGQAVKKYFKNFDQQDAVSAPLKAAGLESVSLEIRVTGGGPRGQAEACRLAVSRCLLKVDENHRKTLKKLGYLMRDPRKKERKKPGLKRARKAPQWSKR